MCSRVYEVSVCPSVCVSVRLLPCRGSGDDAAHAPTPGRLPGPRVWRVHASADGGGQGRCPGFRFVPRTVPVLLSDQPFCLACPRVRARGFTDLTSPHTIPLKRRPHSPSVSNSII